MVRQLLTCVCQKEHSGKGRVAADYNNKQSHMSNVSHESHHHKKERKGKGESKNNTVKCDI